MSFWSKILSASEVSTLYNSGSANTPSSISTNGLTTYYNFEQTGTTLENVAVTVNPITLTGEEIDFTDNEFLLHGFDTNVGFFPIEWDSSTAIGMSISGDTITKNVGDSWSTGIARSVETFTPTDNVSVLFTTSHSNEYVGFAQDPFFGTTKTWQDLEFGMRSDTVVESGSSITPNVQSFTRVSGEDLKMTMDSNGLVKYYYNDVLVHTSTKTASGTYYIEAAIYDQNRSVDTATKYGSVTTLPDKSTNSVPITYQVNGEFQVTAPMAWDTSTLNGYSVSTVTNTNDKITKTAGNGWNNSGAGTSHSVGTAGSEFSVEFGRDALGGVQ